MSTLAELAIANANAQNEVIDNITESSPILADMQIMPSSNGMYHLVEEINRIVGGNIIDPDGPRPSMLAESVLKQKQLSVIGGIMKKGRETVELMGGPGEYFGRKMPTVLRYTGNDVNRSLYYNTLQPFAFSHDKLISAGGSGDALNSLLVVTWMEEELCGLAHPDFMTGGENFMTVNPLNGGDYYDSNGELVYAQDARAFLGVNTANPRLVAGIVNINLALSNGAYTAMPTRAMVLDVLEAARAIPGRSFIYCRPEVRTALGVLFKDQALVTSSGERNVAISIDSIEGISIHADRTLLAAESAVTLS